LLTSTTEYTLYFNICQRYSTIVNIKEAGHSQFYILNNLCCKKRTHVILKLSTNKSNR